MLRLRPFVEWVSARYGGANVYLVGSALTDPYPRDVDIVIHLSTQEFVRRFNCSSYNVHSSELTRYYREISKLSAEASELSGGLPVDLQIQPDEEFNATTGERVRLNMDCTDIIYSKQDRRVIIMRGLPGAGKSTLAEKLRERAPNKDNWRVISTDDLHVDWDGVYRFKVDKISEYHVQTKRLFLQLLMSGRSVIIDNTNLTEGEIGYFYDLALVYDAKPIIVTVKAEPEEAYRRNIHSIRQGTFGYMVRAMEETILPREWEQMETQL